MCLGKCFVCAIKITGNRNYSDSGFYLVTSTVTPENDFYVTLCNPELEGAVLFWQAVSFQHNTSTHRLNS